VQIAIFAVLLVAETAYAVWLTVKGGDSSEGV
jgi:hypothetical protein